MNPIAGVTLKNRCILVADDDPAIRKMVVEILNGEGYETVEAESAVRALELARSHPIDTFLIDIDMQGKNGIEISRELRETEAYRTTPLSCTPGAQARFHGCGV